MILPADIAIEFGFGSTWRTALDDITWTDVSAEYVQTGQGCVVRRGRGTERDRFNAGTCKFQLDNRTRAFDPLYAAGPYADDLLPGVPVRVSATVSGDTHTLFLGYVREWPQEYDLGEDRMATVDIDAADLLEFLARTKSPDTLLEGEALDTTPAAYFPLNESEGDQMVDAAGSFHGEYVSGTTTLSESPTTEVGAKHTGLHFDGEHFGFIPGLEIDTLVTSRPLTVGALIAESRGATSTKVLLRSGNGVIDHGFSFYVSGSAPRFVEAGFRDAGTTWASALLPRDGQPHWCCYRIGAAGDPEMWIDGVDATYQTSSFTSGFAFEPGLSIGGRLRGNDYDLPWVGFASGVAIYDADLADVAMADLATAAITAWDGDTSGERIDHLLDSIDHEPADRDVAAGYTPLGPAVLERRTILQLCQQVEETEQGRFFVARDGKVTFLARYHEQLVASSSDLTFTDEVDAGGRTFGSGTFGSGLFGGGGVRYRSISFNQPRDFINNKVTVTANGHAPVEVTDPTSIATYGELERTIDGPLLQSAQLQRNLAEYVVGRDAQPQTRVTGPTIPVGRDFATYAPVVLPLDIGSRVTVQRTPQGVGDPIALECLIEGIEHRFNQSEWTTTVRLSPASTATYFQWDVSEWDGADGWGY